MKKIFLLLVVIFSLIEPITVKANHTEGKISFLVKSSGQSLFQTMLTVESEQIFQSLSKSKPLKTVLEIPGSHNYVLVEDKGIVRVFMMDDDGTLYDLQQKAKLSLSPSITKDIKVYFRVLQAKHFGELLPWEKVNELIPRYSTFSVTDIDTGLSFKAQRRAGNHHADVQPLTKKDTEIMKRIYEGKWSWKSMREYMRLGLLE